MSTLALLAVLLLAAPSGFATDAPAPPGDGTLSLTVRDAGTGLPTPVRVELLDETGAAQLPPEAVPFPAECRRGTASRPLASDVVTLDEPFGGPTQFYLLAPLSFPLPPGTYRITATKGPEYTVAAHVVDVTAGATARVSLEIARWADMASEGWFSADAHLHVPRPPAAAALDALLVSLMQAEDLNVANLLQMGAFDGLAASPQRRFGAASVRRDGNTIVVSAQENPRTWLLGHGIILGADAYVDFPDDYLAYGRYWREAEARGGLRGYAHLDAGALLRDAVRGSIDFLEVLQFSLTDYEAFYELLDLGVRITPVAGTDFPCWPTPPGTERFYTRVEGPFDHRSWLGGVRAGRTFVTNGPLLRLTVDGHGPGETVRLREPTTVTVEARVRFDPTRDDVERLEIVREGRVVAAALASPSPGELTLTLPLPVGDSTWIAARASGSKLDVPPFPDTPPLGGRARASAAHSAPIYVRFGGQVCTETSRDAAAEAAETLHETAEELRTLEAGPDTRFSLGVDETTLEQGRAVMLHEFAAAQGVAERNRACVPSGTERLTRRHRQCARALGRGLLAIDREVSACITRCLRTAQAPGEFERCIDADPRGRIARAVRRTLRASSPRCAPPMPPFGTAAPSVVTDVAAGAAHELLATVFNLGRGGFDAPDRSARRCRRAAWKAATRCHQAKLRRYVSCARAAMKGTAGLPPASSVSMLRERCLSTTPDGVPHPGFIASKRCVGKSGGGMEAILDAACPADARGAVLGPCGSEGDANAIAQCLDRTIGLRACEAVAAVAGFELLCARAGGTRPLTRESGFTTR
jgi:hypothetical protein